MSDTGLSTAGLKRLHDVMASHVERGALPGLIALVARHGEAHVDVIGTKAFGHTEPLRRDAIFRIASLTKPITAAVAMILVDDGTLRLDSPVEEWLPELADRHVLTSLDAELGDTVPATRPIILEDLLTFRLGFGAIMAPPGTYPIQRAEEELQLRTLGRPWPPTPHNPDAWIRSFGSLPLVHQPGERWMYNTGTHVLGVLLARATGRPLEVLYAERLFDPLGMHDTGFSVSGAQLGRLTTAYAPDQESGELAVLDGVADSYWSRPPTFPDASGWLVSTIDDFWAFAAMMTNNGVHDGERIISPWALDLMTTDRLTPQQRASAGIFLRDCDGWGLGMAVPADGVRAEAIPGGFGWDGGTGTTWRSDLERDLTGILLTQRAMTSPEPPEAFTDFWDCAYGSIED